LKVCRSDGRERHAVIPVAQPRQQHVNSKTCFVLGPFVLRFVPLPALSL
jgi:hypothetical protein